MNAFAPASPRAERLLVEILCRRDEAAGHPLISVDADLGAIRAGGDLAQRIRTRALRLPGSEQALMQIGRVLLVARLMVIALLAVAALAGIAAAGTALGDGRDLSIAMILVALVGVNVFMLLLWTATQFTGLPIPHWLTSLWSRLALGTGASQRTSDAGMEAIRVLSQGAGARWRFGAILHGAWLAYSLAGLLTLLLLLVVRRYELTWQTTLLSDESLRGLANLLSVIPRLLGASGPEHLALNGMLGSDAHRGWALWLVIAVLAYGVAPRFFASIVCLMLAMRTEPRWDRELARPGYARLRDRLMPDRRESVVVDPAAPAQVRESTPHDAVELRPTETLHGVALEWPDAAPPGTSSPWRWFGHADDPASRAAALAQLQAGPVAGLVIVVRATATPDRGLQRFVADLVEAASATTWLALGDMAQLGARGEAVQALRVDDWTQLAANAGASGGLLEWNAQRGTLTRREDAR